MFPSLFFPPAYFPAAHFPGTASFTVLAMPLGVLAGSVQINPVYVQ
jgi:hypothetical protein